MENEIPICGDGWLAVFDLIAPRQLGLEIALLSHRFDYYVDEHFRTRKWTLDYMRIEGEKGENGVKEMQIVNGNWKSMPIPQVHVPKKVVGFKYITIKCIDQNVVDFLRLFRRPFVSCGTSFYITSVDNYALELIMLNLWPLIKDNIYSICLDTNITYHQMRQFVPSLLSDCPSLRSISSFNNVFPAFPSDDSANASDGQLVAKWLFSAPLLLDGAPKVLRCYFFSSLEQWPSKIDAFKMAFAGASSRANFIIMTVFTDHFDFVVPFELFNNSTGERLTLKYHRNLDLLLVRCPIARDEQKWTKWEEEAIKWSFLNNFNQITVI